MNMQDLIKKTSEAFSPGGTMASTISTAAAGLASTTTGGGGHQLEDFDITEIWSKRVYGK